MIDDHGLTAVQEFLKRQARRWEHLFCSVCKRLPPKHPGGPCDLCEKELGASG